ncbi:unnamed protein product [Nippostrongylus brasiliensis]|uniref:Glucose transporter type 1 (inferred by orthology to a D. melanogaster protein) n=1 Tax=Nippostrongylus brasiliensis TaxID=27835 RepID=A0A0N4YPM5_NIPBR|nr:unnamed protein product [Nippostrongylus brasiliensis]
MHRLPINFPRSSPLMAYRPKRCRGVASLASGILLQIAIVTGAILAMPHLFGNVDEWYKLYGFEMVTTIAVMLLVPIIHDSPGHLHSRGLNAECEKSLRFYHDIDGESLRMALKQLDEDASQGDGAQIGLISIWKDPMARRGTLVGSVVMLSMVMSAINAFSFEILLSTGLSISQASYGNVAICVMNVLGILTSSMIIDRFGRRMLLLSTYSLLATTNLAISALMYGFEHEKSSMFGYPLLAAICLFNFSFAAGPGPVSLFITGELVEQKARGAACTWVNVFMCFV